MNTNAHEHLRHGFHECSRIGRILRCLSVQPNAVSASRTSRTTERAAGCSLSLRERVRVRGIGSPLDSAAWPIPELVELFESSVPQGNQQTSGEVPKRFAERASIFPSPRSSPSGRGRIRRCLLAQPSAESARRTSRTTERLAGCSLSQWERVRVMGIGSPLDTAALTISAIVGLCEFPCKAGGVPRE
jgi:hypothetical protein